MLRYHGLSILLLAVVYSACGKSDSPQGSGSGDPHASAVASYCSTIRNDSNKCIKDSDPCEVAMMAACERYANGSSDTALSAGTECVATYTCQASQTDGGMSASQCFDAKMKAAQPSAAQQELISLYCASCGRPSAAECADHFGTEVKGYGDAAVQNAITACGAKAKADADAAACAGLGKCIPDALKGSMPPLPPECSTADAATDGATDT